jgi:hypothetical protein
VVNVVTGRTAEISGALLVDRAVTAEFLAPLRERVAGLRLGPLVSRARQRSVVGHIDNALEQGAHVEFGGEDVPGPGSFVQPTVLTGVRVPVPGRGGLRPDRRQHHDVRVGRAPAVRWVPGLRVPFKEQGAEAMRFYTKVETFAIHIGS